MKEQPNEDPTIAFVRKEVESYERLVQSAWNDAQSRQERLIHFKIILARLEHMGEVIE